MIKNIIILVLVICLVVAICYEPPPQTTSMKKSLDQRKEKSLTPGRLSPSKPRELIPRRLKNTVIY